MEPTTALDKHWVLDNQITEQNSKFNENLFLGAIDLEIKEHNKKLIDLSDNSTDLKTSEFNNELEYDKFQSHYSVLDVNDYFSKTQKWVGHIVELDNEKFISKLEDLNDGGTYEMGEFLIEDVSPEDLELVTVGAIFYLSIGIAMKNGQLKKESILRFQRIVDWNEDDYNSAIDRAQDFFKNLDWSE